MTARLCILAFALCVISAPVLAQPSERTRGLVDQLGAQSWLDRDLATLELVSLSEEISLDDLEFFLADMTLTPEQRARLMQACITRFQAQPKGGLGVAFGAIRVGAIEVQPIQNDPRFPASAMLNMGDAITMVDGVMLNDSTELRVQILSREPGEALPVTVLRNNILIKMDLPLGSFSELSGAARLDPVVVRRTLELRWERKGIIIKEPDMIGSGVDLSHWALAAFPQGEAPNPRTPSRRFSTAVISGAHQLIRTGVMSISGRSTPWVSMEIIGERARELKMMLAGQTIERIRAQRLLLEREAEQLADRLGAGVDSAESRRLQQTIDRIEDDLSKLEDQELLLDQQISKPPKNLEASPKTTP